MIKILFICHGNICRSPMAEFIMKELVRKEGLSDLFDIASRATSYEEIGNDMYPPAKEKLLKEGVPFSRRRAARLTRAEYESYDLIICMDKMNVRNTLRIIGEDSDNKLRLLSDYAGLSRDIADPWYSGDFDRAYEDILSGCIGLLSELNGKIKGR